MFFPKNRFSRVIAGVSFISLSASLYGIHITNNNIKNLLIKHPFETKYFIEESDKEFSFISAVPYGRILTKKDFMYQKFPYYIPQKDIYKIKNSELDNLGIDFGKGLYTETINSDIATKIVPYTRGNKIVLSRLDYVLYRCKISDKEDSKILDGSMNKAKLIDRNFPINFWYGLTLASAMALIVSIM